MPKGKRKGKVASHQAERMEDDLGSACSSSTAGDLGSLSDDGWDMDHDDQGVEEVDDTEARLGDALDALTNKSSKTREAGLAALGKLLADHVVVDFITNRRDTFSCNLERCIKKGGSAEQMSAMQVIRVILCQMGYGADTQVVLTQLTPLLTTMLQDPTKSPQVRAKCAEVLSLGSFIMDELADRVHFMDTLEQLLGWSDSRMRPADVREPFTSRLMASWGFLSTLLPASHMLTKASRLLSSLRLLLENDDLGVRIVAGDLIALIYEHIRSVDEDFNGPEYDGLCTILKQLATDCNKHRSKRDRKVQRSSFRDVLHAVEDRCYAPEETVRLSGGRDALCLNTFSRLRQYAVFKDVLGSGIKAHLQGNEFLRDVFELGAVLLEADPSAQLSRQEKHYHNALASKVRTQARSRQRDKRVFNAL